NTVIGEVALGRPISASENWVGKSYRTSGQVAATDTVGDDDVSLSATSGGSLQVATAADGAITFVFKATTLNDECKNVRQGQESGVECSDAKGGGVISAVYQLDITRETELEFTLRARCEGTGSAITFASYTASGYRFVDGVGDPLPLNSPVKNLEDLQDPANHERMVQLMQDGYEWVMMPGDFMMRVPACDGELIEKT